MTDDRVKCPKKLIEVALPLDKINVACVKEKNPFLKGHPRAIHLWWARRPLAAARAVLFAQLVNDPGYERHLQRGVNKERAAIERERLFGIIERLVLWENTNNEEVLQEAREEIWKSWRETCQLNRDHPQAAELFNPEKLPAFHDPFAGGGAIPLEAQRLGLEAYASDLNPVAVLINKAMIEIPPKFAGKPPVWREERVEGSEERGVKSDALPGIDCLAEGDGGGPRSVSAGSKAAEGGNLRHALANNARDGVRPREHRGGVDARVGQGEEPVSGDSTGLTCRSGNAADPVRGHRLVSPLRNSAPAQFAGRSKSNSNYPAQETSDDVDGPRLTTQSL